MGEFFKSLPEIIESASQSPLAMIAFLVVCICLIAYFFFSRSKPLIKVSIFLVLIVGIGTLVYSLFNLNVSYDDPEVSKIPPVVYTDERPKVIGIYPNNLFGPDHKAGLHESIKSFSNDIDIIDLDQLSYQEMKSGSIEILLERLKYLLENENVLAIAGPSITECTDDILQILEQTKSPVPIFITSAAPRDFLKWDEYQEHINIYRIGTGVDDRAESLAGFLKDYSNFKKTAVLVEKNVNGSKTYGEIFLNQILKHSDNFSRYQEQGKIRVLYYDRESIIEYDSIFSLVRVDCDAVFLLGVGGQFKFTLDKYYKGNYPADSLPKFGGWMFGYVLNEELALEGSKILNNKIFDITDLDISKSLDLNLSANMNIFISKFGSFHPGLRDQAFNFDSGICITTAYNVLRDSVEARPSRSIKFDKKVVQYFNKLIAHRPEPFDGISSEIRFKNGLNNSRELKCAIYDSINNKWKHISNVDLMEL